MSPRITIRDIAARAGVHFSSVSLALRNSPKIRPALREKIQAVARELGYVPDPVLNALNVYRQSRRPTRFQSTIAWINNWPVKDELRRIRSFADYFEGASERARQLGYQIEDFWMHAPGMTPAAATSILHARGVRGLLIAPQPFAHTHLDLDFSEFSALAFGYSLQPARLHIVTNHQFQSLVLAVHELQALGYRRIGLCLKEDWDEKVNNHYLGGLLFAQHRMPARQRVPPLLSKESNRESFIAWFQRHRPDVVIALDRAVRVWIESLGLRVPDDVGVANLNTSLSDSTLAGVYQNDRLIGATAVDVLAGMISRNERGIPATPIRTLVEGVWQNGSSVRALR